MPQRHDLAGFTEAQAHDFVTATFAEPHPACECGTAHCWFVCNSVLDDTSECTTPCAAKPLRFTFIIGGGKLVRSKYDEQLGKWLTAELRRVGYEEDKGGT